MELERFERGESEKFFNRLSKEEKQQIEDFVRYVSIGSKNKTRLGNSKRSLLTFRKVTNTPLSKTTLKDLRDFLSLLNSSDRTQSSRNEIKHTIKRFLKWNFKDWSERFDNLSDIKLIMKMNEEKINADTLLKKEEIEKIMKAEPKLFWKTFFITLYESGLRPIELRNLLWKNVRFDVEGEGITEINLYATKTSKARSVYVKEATFYLKKLKEESKTDLVFPSPSDNTRPMGKENPAIWLKRISKKAIGRQVYPYILRHTRATELYTNAGIPDKIAQKFLGHTQSMGDVYTHLSNKDVKEAIGKTIYKTQEIPEEKKHKLELENEEIKKQIEEMKKQREIDREETRKLSEMSMEIIAKSDMRKKLKPNQIKELLKPFKVEKKV